MDSPIIKAIKYIQDGDISSAKQEMELQDSSISDDDFLEAMRNLEKGIDYILSGQHQYAYKYFRTFLQIAGHKADPFTTSLITILANFCEGTDRLLKGDAHKACELLNISHDDMDKISFLMPDFKKDSLSMKAVSLIAVARTYLDIGDIDEAKIYLGKMKQVHSELLAMLDENRDEDLAYLVEIYGIDLEISLLFSRLDLDVLDFQSLKHRLSYSKNSHKKLGELLTNYPSNQIKTVYQISLILYSVFELFCRVGEKIIGQGSYLNKKELLELDDTYRKLADALNMANEAGERGRRYLFMINQLRRLQTRLLHLGQHKSRKDFGIFSGIIFFIAFIATHFAIYFTVSPSGADSFLFFAGELILGLIVGFGYGAIKFIPLLSVFARIIKAKQTEGSKGS